MRAVVTVIGKDRTGIIAQISSFLAKSQVNILDISQTILRDNFTMIMLVDLRQCTTALSSLSDECEALGKDIGMSIHIQHEDIFNAMHKV